MNISFEFTDSDKAIFMNKLVETFFNSVSYSTIKNEIKNEIIRDIKNSVVNSPEVGKAIENAVACAQKSIDDRINKKATKLLSGSFRLVLDNEEAK